MDVKNKIIQVLASSAVPLRSKELLLLLGGESTYYRKVLTTLVREGIVTKLNGCYSLSMKVPLKESRDNTLAIQQLVTYGSPEDIKAARTAAFPYYQKACALRTELETLISLVENPNRIMRASTKPQGEVFIDISWINDA